MMGKKLKDEETYHYKCTDCSFRMSATKDILECLDSESKFHECDGHLVVSKPQPINHYFINGYRQ